MSRWRTKIAESDVEFFVDRRHPLEEIKLARTGKYDVDGNCGPAMVSFRTRFTPVTGRIGYVWEAVPGLISQSVRDRSRSAVANIFILRPTTPLLLTTARTYETGLKVLSADKRMESRSPPSTSSATMFYVPESGLLFDLAARSGRKALNRRCGQSLRRVCGLWGNAAIVAPVSVNFDLSTATEIRGPNSGMTPNVPSFVANAGASYRFDNRLAVRIGASVRHVGDRSISRTTW